jgi:hypothetical protein
VRSPDADLADATYAESLEGKDLPGGWRVHERVENTEFSGGYNSVGYIVSRGDLKGFLKAYDLQAVLRRAQVQANFDPTPRLNELTAAFMFERDLLLDCRGMDRVINILDHGQFFANPSDLSSFVAYVICELAECDIRTHLARIDRCEVVWRLQTLHHVATGMMQLHTADIAYNDCKPANVLVTHEGRKIGDLGSGCRRGQRGPNDGDLFAGDIRFAPPEVVYGMTEPDWTRRHIACDLFMLGNIAVFLFTQLSMCKLIMKKNLARMHAPALYGGSWRGTFDEVSPYLIDAFAKSLVDFESQLPLPRPGASDYRPDLITLVSNLTHPIPTHRGVRHRDGGLSLALNRLVSQLDLMATRAMVRTNSA